LRIAERSTPVAAVIAAFSTLACCLPLGFLGAIGLAGVGVRAQSSRGWFLGLAVVLLLTGFIQLYGKGRQCRKRSSLSTVILWLSTTIVLLVVLFPQIVASVLAR